MEKALLASLKPSKSSAWPSPANWTANQRRQSRAVSVRERYVVERTLLYISWSSQTPTTAVGRSQYLTHQLAFGQGRRAWGRTELGEDSLEVLVLEQLAVQSAEPGVRLAADGRVCKVAHRQFQRARSTKRSSPTCVDLVSQQCEKGRLHALLVEPLLELLKAGDREARRARKVGEPARGRVRVVLRAGAAHGQSRPSRRVSGGTCTPA
jgi:hypothetical protein